MITASNWSLWYPADTVQASSCGITDCTSEDFLNAFASRRATRASVICAAETAVFRFHVGEARQHGAHTQRRSFATVNSGEQRIGKQLNHLGAVVAFDHLGNSFILRGFARRMKPFGGHAHFCAPGKKR